MLINFWYMVARDDHVYVFREVTWVIVKVLELIKSD